MKIDEVQKIASQIAQSEMTADHPDFSAVLRELGYTPGNFYQELEMSSQQVDTHQDVSYSNTPVSLHSHTFYELLYCHSSGNVEYLAGSERYRLRKGDIILVPPGVSHRPIFPEQMDEPYRRDVIWINADFLKHAVGLISGGFHVRTDCCSTIRTGGTRWDGIGKQFRDGVLEAEEKAAGWELAVVGNTLMILANLKRAYMEHSAGTLKAENRELLDEITAFIEANYASHLTLSDFSKRFYISDSTVSHLFKKKMGVSLYHYVTQRRLIAAKNRILEGIQLEQVAEQVGFSDYSAFYRAFKSEYGISPRQFRNQSLKTSEFP